MSDIRYARTARMFDDPDLAGDLLLVGLAYARFLDFGLPPGKKLSTVLVADCVFPGDRWRHKRVKGIHADDARTYVPPSRSWDDNGCTAPMMRRQGTCDRGSTMSGHITDWETGEMELVRACSRHRDWYRQVRHANREAEPERKAIPAANHGGVLARHIPEFAWPRIWAWATNGRWIEHPESEPWKAPTLTLHLGDGRAAGRSTRPMLMPVDAS